MACGDQESKENYNRVEDDWYKSNQKFTLARWVEVFGVWEYFL